MKCKFVIFMVFSMVMASPAWAYTCNNGILEAGEVCDDGANNSDTAPDHCRSDCRAAGCGDGVTDMGEQCDAGYLIKDKPNTCRKNCTFPRCGDGIRDDGSMTDPYRAFNEECDDGNTNNFDGCTNTCQQCLAVKDDLIITESPGMPLCARQVSIPDKGREGVIIITGDDVTLDCHGLTLMGATTGTGILVEGNGVYLKNCHVSKYQNGIKVRGGGATVTHSNFCGNKKDIAAAMFYNFGTQNRCDTSLNWYEDAKGCSYQCNGARNEGEINSACYQKLIEPVTQIRPIQASPVLKNRPAVSRKRRRRR